MATSEARLHLGYENLLIEFSALKIRIFTLQQGLKDAVAGLDGEREADTRFWCATLGLGAVRDFLTSIKELNEAAEPIDALIGALEEIAAGRPPRLFADMPKAKSERPKATVTTERLARSQVAAAVEVLLAAGFHNDEAFEIVAKELHRAGVRQRNGKVINARLVEEWRSVFCGVGASQEDRDLMEFGCTLLVGQSPTRESAKVRVRQIAEKLHRSI